MTGKEKCRILKQIRQQIALENDIALVIEECTHKGECRGTCPRCESEVLYLERELEKRRSLKKKIALAGISAGLVVSLSGCAVVDAIFDRSSSELTGDQVNVSDVFLMGEVPCEALPEQTEPPLPPGTMAPVTTPDAEFNS